MPKASRTYIYDGEENSCAIHRSFFVEWNGMSVLVEFHNTGDASIRSEIEAIVEHVLSGRPGEWRVSIVGSRAKQDWEMKVEGPNGFERSCTLVGGAGEQQPMVIGNLLLRLLPSYRSG